MKSVIKSVLDGDWVALKKHYEQIAASKVMDRINEKKIGVLARINGIDVDKMKEVINVDKK